MSDYIPSTFKTWIRTLTSTHSDDLDWLLTSTTPSNYVENRPASSVPNKKAKVGRPAKHKQYPELTGIIEDIISENATGAQEKRRDSSYRTCGKSCREVSREATAKLKRLHPGDKFAVASKDTCRRMGLPPHRGRVAASRYKCVIPFKHPARRNDLTIASHEDFHYTASQVNYILDLGFLFSHETLVLSCDNKNKIPIGTMAVSNYYRPRGLHLVEKAPNDPDHTFPEMNAKITPSGYEVLSRKHTRSRSLSPISPHPFRFGRSRSESPPRVSEGNKMFLDGYGRKRIRHPKSGHLFLYLYAQRFHDSTSGRHLNNLLHLLPHILLSGGKSVIILVCDGGPDWTIKSLTNILMWGKLWFQLGLDCLIITCYAPGNSKYNMIERRWASLSKRLSNVILPAHLPNELPPWKQKISQEEKDAKTVEVFDNALEICGQYLKKDRYAGWGTTVVNVNHDSSNIDTYSEEEYRQTHKTLQHPTKNIVAVDPDIKYLKFVLAHTIRTSYKVEIAKCTDTSCDCNTVPVRAKLFMQFRLANGGGVPTPELDLVRSGKHFKTAIGAIESACAPVEKPLDAGKPTGLLGSCEKGCKYVFLSDADKKRHNLIFH